MRVSKEADLWKAMIAHSMHEHGTRGESVGERDGRERKRVEERRRERWGKEREGGRERKGELEKREWDYEKEMEKKGRWRIKEKIGERDG